MTDTALTGARSIRFAMEPDQFQSAEDRQLIPIIGGVFLTEIVRQHPPAVAANHEDFGGLLFARSHPDWIIDQLEAMRTTTVGDRRVAVLACHCGEIGCGSVDARVDAAAGVIMWSDVTSRRWSGGLGPFTFTRHSFDAAVRDVVGRLT